MQIDITKLAMPRPPGQRLRRSERCRRGPAIMARMLPRELDLVSDGIAVAEQQSVDDADGCASQRVNVEHGGP